MHGNKASFSKFRFAGLAARALVGAFLLSSCGPGNRFHSPDLTVTTTKPVIEDQLVPTVTEKENPVKNGVTYQSVDKTIKNKKTEVLLNLVKMEKTKIVYDPATRNLNVSGVAVIYDNQKKEIASNDFDLAGVHSNDDAVFPLKTQKEGKSNSNEKPVVRATVTCLDLNENDHFDCSRVVIDFFIAYKKQIYTEQMERATPTAKKAPTANPAVDSAPKAPPVPDAPKDNTTSDTPSPNTADDDDHIDAKELQSEGEEESLDGRFQGNVATADLDEVFADDEARHEKDDTPDEEPVATPPPTSTAPVPPVTKNSAPAATSPEKKPGTTKPSAPPADLPKAADAKDKKNDPKMSKPPVATPTTAASSSGAPTPAPKKDIPLNRDVVQTADGYVRAKNQSFGYPDAGNLRNATSVLGKQQLLNQRAFFEVVSPDRDRHFGTYEMGEMIVRLGETTNNVAQRKLYVGNVSQARGGRISPHRSHQSGLDVDIGYPATQEKIKFPVVVRMSTRKYDPTLYSIPKTYEILKYAIMQNDIKVDRIFIDQTIKKALCEYAKKQNEFSSADKEYVEKLFQSMDHVTGHGDHFHLRLKCSIYDPGCKQRLYRVNKGCE